MVSLPEKDNGEECTLKFEQAKEKIEINVIYGDVWVCSGQSNMFYSMWKTMNGIEELEASKEYKNIRMFQVHTAFSPFPKDDIVLSKNNTWFDPSDQYRLANFSAICFLYAR